MALLTYITASLLLIACTESTPISLVWTLENPSPTTQSLNAVTFGGSKYVAVGNNKVVVASYDLEIWHSHTALIVSQEQKVIHMVSICSTNGIFLAVGWAPENKEYFLLRSTDTVTWTVAIRDSWIGGVACSTTLGVASTSTGITISNNGGATWTVTNKNYYLLQVLYQSDTHSIFTHLQYLTYIESRHIFMGWASWNRTILTSPDGLRWEKHYGGQHKSVKDSYLDCTAGNEAVVLVGTNVYVTENNLNSWVEVLSGSVGTYYPAITFRPFTSSGIGVFALLQTSLDETGEYHQRILTSSDGSRWLTRFDNIALPNLVDITSGPAGYLAVGESGLMITAEEAEYWDLCSGFTWEAFRWIIFAKNTFIAFAQYTVFTTEDAEEWESIPLAREQIQLLRGSAKPVYSYSLQMFAALSSDFSETHHSLHSNKLKSGLTQVITSPDGITWIPSVGVKNFTGEVAFAGLTSLEKGFLLSAVGPWHAGIFYSPDGKEWKQVNQETVYNLYYAGGFTFGHRLGTILISPDDGVTWKQSGDTDCDNPSYWLSNDEVIISIGFGGCVMTGDIKTVYNTSKWIHSNSGLDVVSDAIVVHNQFLLVGAAMKGAVTTWGYYAISEDGVNWKVHHRGFSSDAQLYSITFGNNMVIGVGRNGFILRAEMKL